VYWKPQTSATIDCVSREHLHMHEVGVSMVNAQIRNGQVIRQGQVEYWDFRQQGNLAVVQPSFAIEPGDAFCTVCNYNANNTMKHVGQGASNEENEREAFLYYFPRAVMKTDFGDLLMCGVGLAAIVPDCEVLYALTPDFTESRQLGRAFGTLNETAVCNNDAPPSNGSVAVPSAGGANEASAASSTMRISHMLFTVVGVVASLLWYQWLSHRTQSLRLSVIVFTLHHLGGA
jgi:Copper type II ascorbate-dependent monooxygenase, C-terminal domain